MEKTDELQKAIWDLINAVEKYVKQECYRGTLLSRKDNLKKLLENKEELPWWREQYYINIPWPESQKLLSLTEAIEEGDIIFGPRSSCFVTIEFYDNILKDELQKRTEGNME